MKPAEAPSGGLTAALGDPAAAAKAAHVASLQLEADWEVAERNAQSRAVREEMPSLAAMWETKAAQDRELVARLFDASAWLVIVAAFQPEVRAIIERPDIRAVVSAMAASPPPS